MLQKTNVLLIYSIKASHDVDDDGLQTSNKSIQLMIKKFYCCGTYVSDSWKRELA